MTSTHQKKDTSSKTLHLKGVGVYMW